MLASEAMQAPPWVREAARLPSARWRGQNSTSDTFFVLIRAFGDEDWCKNEMYVTQALIDFCDTGKADWASHSWTH
ncbi:hypothetical protein AK812_SmicGene21746 [Symbiodinium microadriaticum]|uniref:Uncharacterized protein n=1 Tax=Symbiodinium microadriaticum TaxID=2951 RepID=A0A1Q9DLL5_SYMMI|nr:hypothetical protein AK812_SmicGene21746 [Symbiodinium microadriaticum]